MAHAAAHPISDSVRRLALVLAAVAGLGASPARAEVLFQNTGHLRASDPSTRGVGWERVYTQQMGTIDVVPSPTFAGGEAIRARQVYLGSGDGRYHSEALKFDIQRDGSDLYYGHAIYLPPDWQFHPDNVTFQQWGLENPGGGAPWILMFVIGDRLQVAGVRRAGFGTHTIASIADLRGTWIRVVTRIDMRAPGTFEVWVNGTKRLSLTPMNLTGDGEPPTIRWASGIYCTAWLNRAPAGPSTLEILHDHFRIATTYEEAEPASWREDAVVPPADAGDAGGDARPDAGDGPGATPLSADAGAPVVDGGEPSGAGGSGGSPGTGGGGGGAGRGPGGGAADAAGGPGPSPPLPAPAAGGCSCRLAPRANPTALPPLLLAVAVGLARAGRGRRERLRRTGAR